MAAGHKGLLSAGAEVAIHTEPKSFHLFEHPARVSPTTRDSTVGLTGVGLEERIVRGVQGMLKVAALPRRVCHGERAVVSGVEAAFVRRRRASRAACTTAASLADEPSTPTTTRPPLCHQRSLRFRSRTRHLSPRLHAVHAPSPAGRRRGDGGTLWDGSARQEDHAHGEQYLVP